MYNTKTYIEKEIYSVQYVQNCHKKQEIGGIFLCEPCFNRIAFLFRYVKIF